jgi:hypothetical protein
VAAETAAREAAAETAIGGRNGFVGRLTDENGNLTNEALEHGIRNGYNSIDDAGDRLKQGAVAEKMKEIKAKMEAAKFRPEYQRAVYKVLDNIAKGGERVGLGPADTTFGDIMGDVKFGDVMAARQALNGMSKGVPNKNTAAAQFAKREIDSWLSGGGLKSGDIAAGNPTATIGKLQQLDKGYRALKHAERIKDAMDQAELNAASAGKGTNYANAMRQQAKAILAKDRRGQIPSLDPSVRAGLNKVARGTAYGLRAGSVFAPTGIVSLGGAELFAHAMGMPGAGLAFMAAGHLARKGEEAIVRGTANRALNLARAQAPMTQAFGRLAPRAASTQPPPMAMLPFLGARARGFGDPQNAKQ